MNPIEQEVREMLRTKVSQAPVRDEPPPVVIRRARTLRVVNAIGATAAAAAVVIGVMFGVQSLGDRRVVEPLGPVPWIEMESGPPAVERDLPECRVEQLSATLSNELFGAQIDFTLKGNKPCRLWPVLKLGIRDAAGRDIPVVFSGQGYTTYLDPKVRVPFGIVSMDRCGPDLSELTFVATMSESKGELVIRPDVISLKPSDAPVPPACTETSPARLHFVAMQPVAAKPALPSFLEYGMTVPAAVEQGGILRYEVTITNPTARAVPLAPCPEHWQVLLGAQDARGGAYVLNCGGANGSIPAGGRVTFQMEMNLTNVAAGDWVLTWGADGIGSYPTARVRIV